MHLFGLPLFPRVIKLSLAIPMQKWLLGNTLATPIHYARPPHIMIQRSEPEVSHDVTLDQRNIDSGEAPETKFERKEPEGIWMPQSIKSLLI